MKLSRLEGAVILIAAVFLSFTAGWFLRDASRTEPLIVESERRLETTVTTLPAPVTPAPVMTPAPEAPAAEASAVPAEASQPPVTPTEALPSPLPASPSDSEHPAEELEGTEETEPEEKKININTADAETLMTLPGIGEKRAEAIIADREANGPFRFPEDLTRVKGIGDGILKNMLDQITTGEN